MKKRWSSLINLSPFLLTFLVTLLVFINSFIFNAQAQNAQSEKDDKGDQKEKECSICLNSIPKENHVAIAACKHEFHTTCLKKWLRGQKALFVKYVQDDENKRAHTCPMCRVAITPEEIQKITPALTNDQLSDLYYSVLPFYKTLYNQKFPHYNGPWSERPAAYNVFSKRNEINVEMWQEFNEVKELFEKMQALEIFFPQLNNQFHMAAWEMKKFLPLVTLSLFTLLNSGIKANRFSELDSEKMTDCILSGALGVTSGYWSALILGKSLSHLKEGIFNALNWKFLKKDVTILAKTYEDLEDILTHSLEEQVNLPAAIRFFYRDLLEEIREKKILLNK